MDFQSSVFHCRGCSCYMCESSATWQIKVWLLPTCNGGNMCKLASQPSLPVLVRTEGKARQCKIRKWLVILLDTVVFEQEDMSEDPCDDPCLHFFLNKILQPGKEIGFAVGPWTHRKLKFAKAIRSSGKCQSSTYVDMWTLWTAISMPTNFT